MKYIECTCKQCENEFKITFKEDIPPFEIKCPICSGDVIYNKINHSEESQDYIHKRLHITYNNYIKYNKNSSNDLFNNIK